MLWCFYFLPGSVCIFHTPTRKICSCKVVCLMTSAYFCPLSSTFLYWQNPQFSLLSFTETSWDIWESAGLKAPYPAYYFFTLIHKSISVIKAELNQYQLGNYVLGFALKKSTGLLRREPQALQPQWGWPCLALLLFSCYVVSDSLWPHELKLTRLPCPSLSPGVC